MDSDISHPHGVMGESNSPSRAETTRQQADIENVTEIDQKRAEETLAVTKPVESVESDALLSQSQIVEPRETSSASEPIVSGTESNLNISQSTETTVGHAPRQEGGSVKSPEGSVEVIGQLHFEKYSDLANKVRDYHLSPDAAAVARNALIEALHDDLLPTEYVVPLFEKVGSDAPNIVPFLWELYQNTKKRTRRCRFTGESLAIVLRDPSISDEEVLDKIATMLLDDGMHEEDVIEVSEPLKQKIAHDSASLMAAA